MVPGFFLFSNTENNLFMKNIITTLLFLVIISLILPAQEIKNPIVREKSHSTLFVRAVNIDDNNTIVDLSIKNELERGGWFCASDSILLITQFGDVYNLEKSENIPVCPDQHEFKNKGEVLNFRLYFEPVPENTNIIDILEICDQSCFFLKGIILNPEHNQHIKLFERGIDLVSNDLFVEAIPYFVKTLEGSGKHESSVYGLSYYYLILIYDELDQKTKALEYFEDLKKSDVPDKNTIVKKIEELNIF